MSRIISETREQVDERIKGDSRESPTQIGLPMTKVAQERILLVRLVQVSVNRCIPKGLTRAIKRHEANNLNSCPCCSSAVCGRQLIL